jgi:hypothetical protein
MLSKSNKFTTPVVGTPNKSSEIIPNLLMCKCTLLAERTDVVYWSLTVEMKLKKVLTRPSQGTCTRVQLRARSINFGIE